MLTGARMDETARTTRGIARVLEFGRAWTRTAVGSREYVETRARVEKSGLKVSETCLIYESPWKHARKSGIMIACWSAYPQDPSLKPIPAAAASIH